jgi:hypothetical protein
MREKYLISEDEISYNQMAEEQQVIVFCYSLIIWEK